MKKLLLTLGTAASVVAPLATVVACGEEAKKEVGRISYDSETKTLTVREVEFYWTVDEAQANYPALYSLINIPAYHEATTIEMEITTKESGEEVTFTHSIAVNKIEFHMDGAIPTTLKEYFALGFTEIDGVSAEANAIATIISAIGKSWDLENGTEVKELQKAISELSFESSFTSGDDFRSHDASDAVSMSSAFGIAEADYNILNDIFDNSEWTLGLITGIQSVTTTELTVILTHPKLPFESATLPITFA